MVVVDIDRESLARQGSWPWPRERLAALVERSIDLGAVAVGLDVVLVGTDPRSPGTAARRLASETGIAAFAELAEALPDGDHRLAETVRTQPIALGFVLDPTGVPPPPFTPFLTRQFPALDNLWSNRGVQGPSPDLIQAAAGLGFVSLPGDADGIVRRVPVLAIVDGRLAPGLAAETMRLATGAAGYLLAGPNLEIHIGDHALRLPEDGMLRLVPRWADARQVSAHAVLDLSLPAAALAGRIVLIGSSAPELGGLRSSAGSPLKPSVMLQAQAMAQIEAGVSPTRIEHAVIIETALAVTLAAAGIWLAIRLSLALGLLGLASLALLAAAFQAWLAGHDLLFDALPAVAGIMTAFFVTSLVSFAAMRRSEGLLRRRFAQRLAPGVVERIVAQPESLRLQGERRIVTAMFSDLEGFAKTAAATEPEQLIAVLDGYFEGVSSIIVRHGGMVDKFVGDAVNAFFNVPLDLADHADKAVICACEIVEWTNEYRKAGLAASIGLGRTRIGIETGEAVVGDVGLATKLDYTAHGIAVSTAARLENLNKTYGTDICVGPVAASACRMTQLRSLGAAEVRGIGMFEVFSPELAGLPPSGKRLLDEVNRIEVRDQPFQA